MKRIIGWLIQLLSNPLVAQIVVRFGPRTLRLGKLVFVFRWADVCHVLESDENFLIPEASQARIEAVSGPFILGMNRSPDLIRQRNAAYRALAKVDWGAISTLLGTLPSTRLDHHSGDLDIVNGYARPIAGEIARTLFGLPQPAEKDLLRVARAIFHETFLNVAGDEDVAKVGRSAGVELTEWILDEIKARRSHNAGSADMLGGLLSASAMSGMQDEEIAWILAGFFVGSIDTTATSVTYILSEAMANPSQMRAMQNDVDTPRALRGWCWETLRRRPHNDKMLRTSAAGAAIGNRNIAAGSRVFLMTIAAMQDPAAFPSPQRMDPTRPEDRYLHFGRGLHHCGGRDLNAIQIPALVGALIRKDPKALSKIENEGPFPNKLVVSFHDT